MNKYLRQGLDFLLFSNLFIALCAVAQALVTYQLLHAEPNKHILGLLFCSTLVMYNYSILLSKPAKPEQSPFRRVRWIFSHHRLTVTITIISLFSLAMLVLFLSLTSQILLLFLGMISAAYNLPMFSIDNKKFGLRNLPGIKLFLIALVWSLSCVLLPIIELEQQHILNISNNTTLLLIAKRFLFIAAITLPFDIRDLYQDRNHELKTIPVVLGERKAYLFCLGLLVIYLVLLSMFTREFDSNFWGLTLTIILSGWLIFKSEWKRDEYYYFLYLDGTLILQFLTLILCSKL